MELEKRLLQKESELDHVESDKLNMNDKMELLKSKMDAAMKTNKRLLDNATNTINEHMEMNIKLVKEKETLSITIENLKRSLKAENEAKHLRKQVKTIKEGEDIIRINLLRNGNDDQFKLVAMILSLHLLFWQKKPRRKHKLRGGEDLKYEKFLDNQRQMKEIARLKEKQTFK